MRTSIKLIPVVAALLLVSASAAAQNTASDDKYPRNWFIGAGAGMNVGFDGQAFTTREGSHAGVGTAGDFYFGKFFGRTLGFRAGYQGFTISDRYTDYGKNTFGYAHADLLFRVANGFVPYIHGGYARIASGTPAGGVGVMFPIAVGRRVSIVPDIKALAMDGASYDGVNHHFGGIVSGTVGLRVALGPVSRKKPVVTDGPFIPVGPDTSKTDPVDTTSTSGHFVQPDNQHQTSGQHQTDQPATLHPRPELGTILFAFRSDVISVEAAAVIGAWADYLLDHPDKAIRIEGHTCTIGTEPTNRVLSLARAQAVRNFLVYRGIDPARITVAGFGSTRPAVDNTTVENRARNRRAEIIVE